MYNAFERKKATLKINDSLVNSEKDKVIKTEIGIEGNQVTNGTLNSSDDLLGTIIPVLWSLKKGLNFHHII